jgi:hypothetical protein
VLAILVMVEGLQAVAARSGLFEPRPPVRVEPAAVRDRTPLPSCGEDKLLPNGDPVRVEAHRCLLDAYVAGQTAELAVVDWIATGERTEQIIRVLAGGSVEIFVHTGEDYTTTAGWERRTCTALRPANAPKVLELVGCGAPAEIK